MARKIKAVETPKEEKKKTKSFESRVGISSETLKVILNRDSPPTKDSPLKSFYETINSRIKDGRARSLKDYRAWAAVDLAFQVPFNQVTPTILGKIISTATDPNDALKQLESWGISERTLFTDGLDANGQPAKFLNEQTFYKVLVPAVMTYSEARIAKLYNDRDVFPLLKYEPFTSTEENVVIDEALTSIMEKQGHQMGDRATLKQVIYQGVKYSTVLTFPMEAWYCEKSADEKGNEYCVKEGLRYQIPHPTRMFWDMSHRAATFNTDNGCDYAGYWRVMRWGDVKNNKGYWNRDKVEYGKSDWGNIYSNYFKEVYPCTMKFPTVDTKDSSREAANTFYTTGDHDKAVMVTDFFWKLIPKDWGLGEYKYNCWFRFVVASDDTIIFAEPLPYPPVLYMGLDVDENQSRNASFSQKIIPFADHIGNILSQIVLSMRQNATKIVVYDDKQIAPETLKALKNQCNDVNKMHFIGWDSKKSLNAQLDPSKMLFTLPLPQQPVAEQTNTLNIFISVMERMLGISPQETGQSAVHVTTAAESRIQAGNTSQRVDFTGTGVDDFLDAWKKQKHRAAMAFMDEEFIVEVSRNTEYLPALKALGFELLKVSRDKYVIKGEKSKLAMEAFVSVRDGKNRINNEQLAVSLMQTIQMVSNGPLASGIGIPQMVDWVNYVLQLSGAPKDRKFQVNPEQDQAQQLQQLQQKVEQLTQELQKAQADGQSDQIKAQADIQKTQMVVDKDILITEMRNATEIEKSRIAASVKIGVSQHEMEEEYIALGIQHNQEQEMARQNQQHETALQQQDQVHQQEMQPAGQS